MAKFVLRRLIQAIPLLILLSFLTYIIMLLAPGDAASLYAENPRITAADRARIVSSLGLDRPWYEQYGRWAWGMVTGNWGRSFTSGRPVLEEIYDRLWATLQLMMLSFLISFCLAVPLGIISAIKRYSFLDWFVTTGSLFGVSIPTFWFGLMAQMVFAVYLRWLPSGGQFTIGMGFNLLDRLRYILMPAFVLGLVSIAGWSRYVRSSMLDVLGQDYIRTARAKGLTEKTVIFKHALKNALIPVVTIMGLELPAFFGGAVITESIFAWPGMGRLLFTAVMARNYPIVMGIVMITAVLVIAGNLLADITYAFL
ncbi:MAG: ABC transporter permease, partial [Bacteroidota bacterium]